MSLENRGLVIFGATDGIGSTLVTQLAPLGCRLTLVARDPTRLDTLAGEFHADACPSEAKDSAAVDRCLAQASERYGRLDGVVNCIGSLCLKAAHTTTDADWDEVLATNLTTSFHFVRASARLMMRGGGGSIVQPPTL